MKESALKFWGKVFGNVTEILEWVHPVTKALHRKTQGKTTDQEKDEFVFNLEKYLHQKK